MAESEIGQEMATALIRMPKRRVDDAIHYFPGPGGGMTVPLASSDGREAFVLDAFRGRIEISKATFQNRGRQVIVLVRVDVGGAPHRNPDGEQIACPHIHAYREGYGDRWASPLPQDAFPEPTDLWRTLLDFMAYCNVVEPPIIEKELFA
jgi:hypothetical protein